MNSSEIHNKTIRPGSLNGYYYYSGGRPQAQVAVKQQPTVKKTRRGSKTLMTLLITGALLAGGYALFGKSDKSPESLPTGQQAAAVVSPQASSSAKPAAVNYCAGNKEAKLIKIGVHKRKLWACEGEKEVKSSPVITGLRGHAETETPVGTYKVYGKTTNTTLTGSDSRGAWRDPVYYWMPFLDNQYGTYGFHDATWRPADEFGNISPDSQEASHGCVELPLETSKWLYDWAPVGTVVTVEA